MYVEIIAPSQRPGEAGKAAKAGIAFVIGRPLSVADGDITSRLGCPCHALTLGTLQIMYFS